ncbi:MAG: aminopeptidase P family protein [Bdellovibrionales bacterium]|nr:aminopeptidase P family protein [Bdellovibrionales bacterium]
MAMQDFGENFDLKQFYHARDIARDMAHELASKITPGMVEDEAHDLYKKICVKHGVEKNWHPAKLRFGPNTLKDFKEVSDPYTLQEDDIFYVDIGPVISGHEADYGETFTLGSNFEHRHVADCSKKIFDEVSVYWKENKTPGPKLYEWAKARAKNYGYILNMGSDGHRIGDFPHHVFFKGAIIECDEELLPNAWILEIQLDHPKLKFGAFYEDILK